ncbi:hypothetical protein OG558_08295 [Kribbella sp. NBC_01510]|uniref:hypothetical protein n=1 Tax=Kribbella sp. NBC_01510 TaxID=2903581 RepID=UPI003868BBF6
MGEVTSSPMGKTYLSTAVTEDGKPKQLVSNTRTRLEFAEVPNRNDEGPRACMTSSGRTPVATNSPALSTAPEQS